MAETFQGRQGREGLALDRAQGLSETEKAAANFGRGRTPRELVRAYAAVKKACLEAVFETRRPWPDFVFRQLVEACDEVMEGLHDALFVLPLQQGGAGTSLNMNLNEVLANIANGKIDSEAPRRSNTQEGSEKGQESSFEPLQPLSDINRFQSTNDTFATACTIVAYEGLAACEKLVIRMQEILVRKEREHATLLMSARTELQDALPITLGQVFGSWAGLFERDRWRLAKLRERLRSMALGGTAVGTGFAAPRDYVFAAEKHLRRITGLPLCRSQNLVDEISHLDKYSELASGLRLVAENIFKMTGDLLLYGSSFAGELLHPDLQKGSSIMAAKTNPVILEFARGLAMDAQGECLKVSLFCQNGQLQLNAFLPFVLDSLLRIFSDLDRALSALAEKFFPALEVRPERMEKNLLSGEAILNALVPKLGYDKVRELHRIWRADLEQSRATLETALREVLGMTAEEIAQCLDPGRLAGHGKD